MEDDVNHAAVGAFALVLGALLVAGVLWLAAGIERGTPMDRYDSVMTESVSGLNVDSPVKYLGVDVGKVSRITLDPDNPRQVRLQLLVERGTPIKPDTDAVLQTQGLTGIAYVELSGGSPAAPDVRPVPGGAVPVIRSKPSLSARLENVLTAVLTNVDRVSRGMNALLDDENRAAFKQTLADVSQLARTLAEQQDAVRAGIADARTAARNTAQASAGLAPALERVGAAAAALERMAGTAGVAGERAVLAIDRVDAGARRLGDETLPEAQRLLQELNRLSTSLRQVSEQVERDPSSLLTGSARRPLGPGEQAPR